MADLSVNFAGLDLKNPIIISSAGITENVRKMRLCQENGAAAVVIKSYFEEEVCRKSPSPRYQMIEHDMDVVFALADVVTVLVKGQAIATGTPDEVRADLDVRRAYLGDY